MSNRILCATPSLTMRTLRQMEALAGLGHKIDLAYCGIGENVARSDWKRPFKKVTMVPKTGSRLEHFSYLSPKKFLSFFQAQNGKGYDLVHACSNFDTLAIAAEQSMKAPVVFDVRDMASLFSPRSHGKNYIPRPILNIGPLGDALSNNFYNRIRRNERVAMEGADGVIYTSDYMKRVVDTEYSYDIKRSLVFYNYLPREYLPKARLERHSAGDGKLHLAYEGVLSTEGYRDLLPNLLRFLGDGTVMHVFGTGTPEAVKEYTALSRRRKNFRYEGFFEPGKLIEELSRCDVGIFPFHKSVDGRHVDSAFPNKVFDYLGAGLPIASTPAYSMVHFLKHEKVGRILDVEKLGPGQVKKALETMAEITFDRERFVMEGQIGRLEKMYSDVLRD